jgi:hypothetical protein
LARGADIIAQTVTGKTALRIATENLYPEVLDLLLKKGALTDVFDNSGFIIVGFAKTQRE